MVLEKVDFKKIYGDEYIPHMEPKFVRNLAAKYLTIVGQGEPFGDGFVSNIEALFSVALSLQQTVRKEERDFDLHYLEAVWWGSSQDIDYFTEPVTSWKYKLLTRVPHFITEERRMEIMMSLMDQGADPNVGEVKLESLKEGLCVQMLHTGPHARVAETVARMKSFMQEEDVQRHGLYHDIYLSNIRKAKSDPQSLRFIVRVPVS